MGILQVPTKWRWMIIATIVVAAIIWRLLYTWQGFMNFIWMNAAIVSMALSDRWFFRPLGFLALTATAVLITVTIAGALILLQKVLQKRWG